MRTKYAVLACLKRGGGLVSFPSETLEPLLETAKAARVTGLVGDVAVLEGIVMASWRGSACYKFTVDADAAERAAPKKAKGKG